MKPTKFRDVKTKTHAVVLDENAYELLNGALARIYARGIGSPNFSDAVREMNADMKHPVLLEDPEILAQKYGNTYANAVEAGAAPTTTLSETEKELKE